MNGDHDFDDADIIDYGLKKFLLETFPLVRRREWLNGVNFVSILVKAEIDKNVSINLVRTFFKHYYDNLYDDLNYLEELDATMEEIAYAWNTILQEGDYPKKIRKALMHRGNLSLEE